MAPLAPSPTFGEALRRFRLAAGLTQEALAERAGLSARAISDLERGERTRPYRETVALLAAALGLSDVERQALARLVVRRSPLHRAAIQARGGLPRYPTTLIGRERAVAEVADLLRRPSPRLVTLIGPGGVGKTRLALGVAEAVRDHFAAGLCWVDLAPLRQAAEAAPAVAAALGLLDGGPIPLDVRLREALRDAHLLLVLDNVEHLLPAGPAIAALLADCPDLRVLATSRAVLQLGGELVWPVPALPLPDERPQASAPELLRSPAVRLFAERAEAALPTFRLTSETVPLAADICRRLDGLPLAIELAAARVRALPLSELRAQLARSLAVLTGGGRDAPARQRTLRATLDWSYGLLEPAERRLFRRLGVFRGGFSLSAVEGVAADRDRPADALDGLCSLLDRSLLVRDGADEEARFRLLETVREYALERLAEDGEAAALHERHAGYYLDLAEAAARGLRGPEQADWYRRLAREQDNVLAALAWATEGRTPERVELACRFAAALWRFWSLRGDIAEGRRRLDAVLAVADTLPTSGRIAVLVGAANLAREHSEYPAARSLAETALAEARARRDTPGVASALVILGTASLFLGAPAAACFGRLQEAVALWRELGDRWETAAALDSLGQATRSHGDLRAAVALHQASLDLRRAIGDRWGAALALHGLCRAMYLRGDAGAARAYGEESVAILRELGDTVALGRSLLGQGNAAFHAGALEAARSAASECIGMLQRVGHPVALSRALDLAAGLVGREGRSRLAATLGGAAEGIRARNRSPLFPNETSVRSEELARWRGELGPAAFEAAWAEGERLRPAQAADLARAALASTGRDPAPTRAGPVPFAALTPREREVAALIGRGCSNRQIARQLTLSERTVANHVEHILGKLALRSRTQVALWVAERDGRGRDDDLS